MKQGTALDVGDEKEGPHLTAGIPGWRWGPSACRRCPGAGETSRPTGYYLLSR